MVELVYTLDLGSRTFGRAGSNPAARILINSILNYGRMAEWLKALVC